MLSPKILRLLSLVFLAAVLPLLGLFAVLVKASMPNADGGMEPTVAMICYVAFAALIGAMVIVAINFSRQLAREARGERRLP